MSEKSYLVTWTMEIGECDSPHDAAEKALLIQRDPNSTATFFEVSEVLSRFRSDGRPWELGETIEVDLYDEGDAS